MVQWINHINKAYINVSAPTIKVFKLDKAMTNPDNLYGEEMTSRIYLNPFTIRAFHLDNTWKQLLLADGTGPYKEEEENIQFVMNFENMVQRIRALKSAHVAEMAITYQGTLIPYASKIGNFFTIKAGSTVIGSFDVTNSNYNTVQKLGNAINNISAFKVILLGRNDTAINLVNFAETSFKANTLVVYSVDRTYSNLTEIIEAGDCVLSNKWRLYEVMNANPAGDIGWDYVTYIVSCKLANVLQCQLPGDYKTKIQAYAHNIGQKLFME
jgi:hypothetical protein